MRVFSTLMLWTAMGFGWLLWKARGQPKVGLWFALLLGISPFWWYQSHEMRGYTMALACVMACLWLQQQRMARSPSSSLGLADFGMPLAFGLAAFTNFYVVLLAPVLFAQDLFQSKTIGWKRVSATQSLMLILGVLLAWNYLDTAQGTPPASGFTRPFSWLQMLGLAHGFLLGLSWGASLVEIRNSFAITDPLVQYWPWYLASSAAVLLVLLQIRNLKIRWGIYPEIWLAALALAIVGWLSFRHGYPAAPRHLLLLTPFLFGGFSLVAAQRPLTILPLVLCFLLSSAFSLTDPRYGRENWRETLAVARHHAFSPKSSLVFTQSDAFIFDIYLPFQTDPWKRVLNQELLKTSYPTDPSSPWALYRFTRWTTQEPPDFLIVARPWELPSHERERLRTMMNQMRVLYESSGVCLYRRLFPVPRP